MTPSSGDHPDGHPYAPSMRPDIQRDAIRDSARSSEQPIPTPDAHIHSSIPLGIILQADGAASTAIDDSPNNLVPTTIVWRGAGGKQVQVSGTFESSWSRRISMSQESVSMRNFFWWKADACLKSKRSSDLHSCCSPASRHA